MGKRKTSDYDDYVGFDDFVEKYYNSVTYTYFWRFFIFGCVGIAITISIFGLFYPSIENLHQNPVLDSLTVKGNTYLKGSSTCDVLMDTSCVGITSLTNGNGITITQPSTVSHTLSTQVLLNNDNSFGPSVEYLKVINMLNPNFGTGWYTTNNNGPFQNTISPGAFPGSNGVGNVGNNQWRIPSPGIYSFSLTSYISSELNFTLSENIYTFCHAVSFDSSTIDPHDSGFMASGSETCIDLTRESNDLIALEDHRISSSFIVQAGCSGCPIQVNDFLSLHGKFSFGNFVIVTNHIHSFHLNVVKLV